MTHDFETTFHWCQENRAFVATVPKLPGCRAQGLSLNEALANARQAMHQWLETAKKSGTPIPEPVSDGLRSETTYPEESATTHQK